MAITNGRGNANWTRDEVVLALEILQSTGGKALDDTDTRVRDLSKYLQGLPIHATQARKESFRNAAGVAFKLQNLKAIATGKGLSNASKVDLAVWNELGNDVAATSREAAKIRSTYRLLGGFEDLPEVEEVFQEGELATLLHVRRERSPAIRKSLLARRRRDGNLCCDACGYAAPFLPPTLAEAVYEAHHLAPLASTGPTTTKLSDMTLLCACCHRFVHRLMTIEKRGLDLQEIKIALKNASTLAPA